MEITCKLNSVQEKPIITFPAIKSFHNDKNYVVLFFSETCGLILKSKNDDEIGSIATNFSPTCSPYWLNYHGVITIKV